MKMSDRRLKRILQENPVPVKPEKKEAMLEFARMCDEQEKNEETEDGSNMKYMRTHKFRTLIAAAVILSLMAVAVTAGIVNYYYRTPGGKIFDQNGTIVETPENMSLKMTGEALHGNGYTIENVNWVSCGGQSTFTVWLSADSEKPESLCAQMDGVEYPLTESFSTFDPDGNLLCTAYSTTNMPEPQNWSPNHFEGTVRIVWNDSLYGHNIYFEPTDIQPVQTTADDITITGYMYDGRIFFGAKDNVLLRSELGQLISATTSSFYYTNVTDTSGTLHENALKSGYGVGSGGIIDTSYELSEGIVPASVHIEQLNLNVSFAEKENVTCCDLPIPEEGETLTGEWTIMDFAGMKITITEITRDKYSVIYYSPDASLIAYNGKYCPFDTTCFADGIGQIQISTSFRVGDSSLIPTSLAQPREGRKWRIASKTLSEFAETHDTIRLCIDQFYITYSGDWTLTFPEN